MLSKPRSVTRPNFDVSPWVWGFFRKRLHSIGVSVTDTTPEIRIATQIVTENSRNSRPRTPPMKSTGMNTAASEDRKSTSELQSRQYLVCRLLLEKKRYAPSYVSPAYHLHACFSFIHEP